MSPFVPGFQSDAQHKRWDKQTTLKLAKNSNLLVSTELRSTQHFHTQNEAESESTELVTRIVTKLNEFRRRGPLHSGSAETDWTRTEATTWDQ